MVGAGAVGTALALALQRAGWPLDALVCRSAERAAARAALVGAGRPLALDAFLAEPAPAAPVLLLLGAPDRHLAELAACLAERRWAPGSVALHLSGSVELDALAPLRGRGVAVGAAHPLHSFVDPEHDAAALADCVLAVECDAAARPVVDAFADALGARAFPLAPGARAAWHAAATHACNHLVALLDQSLDLMHTAGLARDDARRALLPLLAGTLENLRRHPPGAALTGPVVRGDAAVVARHLAALADEDPDIARSYRALARRALRLAAASRDLDPVVADRLRATLAEPEP